MTQKPDTTVSALDRHLQLNDGGHHHTRTAAPTAADPAVQDRAVEAFLNEEDAPDVGEVEATAVQRHTNGKNHLTGAEAFLRQAGVLPEGSEKKGGLTR